MKSIEELDTSVRLYNILKINNIDTLDDIIKDFDKIIKFKGMGSKMIKELNKYKDSVD